MTKLLFLTLFVSSCLANEEEPINHKNGGVILSFDDNFVDSWYSADSILSQTSWKATFCIYKPHKLLPSEINKLVELNLKGHEISGHGFESRNSINSVEKNGLSWYIEKEIIPLIDTLKNYSFNIGSFAYPQGASNEIIDSALFNYFDILRKTTYGDSIPEKHNCYYDGNLLVHALGIDNHYDHYNPSYIMDLLDYARLNNKILILYSHNPVNNARSKYETDISLLKDICDFVNSNNMKFYTLQELRDL